RRRSQQGLTPAAPSTASSAGAPLAPSRDRGRSCVRSAPSVGPQAQNGVTRRDAGRGPATGRGVLRLNENPPRDDAQANTAPLPLHPRRSTASARTEGVDTPWTSS